MTLMNNKPFNPEAKTSRQLSGRIGEDAVALRYAAEGYTVLARNLHIGHKELDLILRNQTHIVFVEVKTRHAAYGARSRYGRPATSVDKAKRARTVEAAEAYLREHRNDFATPLQPRIDVAEVYLGRRADGGDEVTHIEIFRNAFGAK